jgi:hypothetical protein
MQRSPIRDLGYIAAAIGAFLIIYAGTYCFLVRRGTEVIFDPSKDSLIQPDYQIENYLAYGFFAPIHAIDRRVRARYWSDDELLKVLREGHRIPPRRPWWAQTVRE